MIHQPPPPAYIKRVETACVNVLRHRKVVLEYPSALSGPDKQGRVLIQASDGNGNNIEVQCEGRHHPHVTESRYLFADKQVLQ